MKEIHSASLFGRTALLMGKNYEKMYQNGFYRLFLLLFGLPTTIVLFAVFLLRRQKDNTKEHRAKIKRSLDEEGFYESALAEIVQQQQAKNAFFNHGATRQQIEAAAEKLAAKRVEEEIQYRIDSEGAAQTVTFPSVYRSLSRNPAFLLLSILTSFPMYVLILLYINPYLKYTAERLFMLAFVLIGVTALVFSILYISPIDPAYNVLGERATEEQREDFRQLHGLNEPYPVQLVNVMKGLVTFDMGKSYVGNSDVFVGIMSKFPVTLKLSLLALVLALIVSIPAGIISAIRQYSAFDYTAMIAALIGLSIPSFWFGLILLLNFSVKHHIFPATFAVDNPWAYVLPAIVMATALAGNVARMTRSSMLEIKNQDYVLTARAKGISENRVIVKHILGNALIPIVTAAGIQFGYLLGGSAVIEKVFNVNGIGSFIVDKQYIPDIPVVLTGVIYVAVVVSLVNLFVDLLYAFIDPRVKAKLRNY